LSQYGQAGDNFRVICHTFIKAGMIEFLGDCTHKLKGQTVPLPPLPDWICRPGDNSAET
jgi:hypothetical protein